MSGKGLVALLKTLLARHQLRSVNIGDLWQKEKLEISAQRRVRRERSPGVKGVLARQRRRKCLWAENSPRKNNKYKGTSFVIIPNVTPGLTRRLYQIVDKLPAISFLFASAKGPG